MYQPPHFRQDDLDLQHALIRAHPLALVITAGQSGILANPVPVHLDAGASEKGTLRLHVARANPQWQEIEAGADLLLVFEGPDAYVTPSFYQTKRDTGKVVPTWNYVMVQVRGRATVHQDADWLQRQITALTEGQENGRPDPWAVSDAPHDFIAMQMRAIIGVEVEITEITGKWKVSQNRPEADRQGVVAGYEAAGNAEMAGLVKRFGKI
nr:FMN-binding negative transcriptional regulator [uncultured Gellertiella sp.]